MVATRMPRWAHQLLGRKVRGDGGGPRATSEGFRPAAGAPVRRAAAANDAHAQGSPPGGGGGGGGGAGGAGGGAAARAAAPAGADAGGPAFAAAWLAAELARGASLEDLVAAACAEGGAAAGPDAAALRAAAARAAAGGGAAAALAALLDAAAPHAGRMAPHAPYDGYLHGPPKPACHAARVVTADAVNKLRATRDGEIGERRGCLGWGRGGAGR
jgi:hypothetical protein